jgi:hypothetical protein
VWSQGSGAKQEAVTLVTARQEHLSRKADLADAFSSSEVVSTVLTAQRSQEGKIKWLETAHLRAADARAAAASVQGATPVWQRLLPSKQWSAMLTARADPFAFAREASAQNPLATLRRCDKPGERELTLWVKLVRKDHTELFKSRWISLLGTVRSQDHEPDDECEGPLSQALLQPGVPTVANPIKHKHPKVSVYGAPNSKHSTAVAAEQLLLVEGITPYSGLDHLSPEELLDELVARLTAEQANSTAQYVLSPEQLRAAVQPLLDTGGRLKIGLARLSDKAAAVAAAAATSAEHTFIINNTAQRGADLKRCPLTASTDACVPDAVLIAAVDGELAAPAGYTLYAQKRSKSGAGKAAEWELDIVVWMKIALSSTFCGAMCITTVSMHVKVGTRGTDSSSTAHWHTEELGQGS